MAEDQPTGSGASDIENPEATPPDDTKVDSEPGGEAPPEVIDLDQPPPGLPDLTFPSSDLLEDREAAARRRARRLRIELGGGAILLLIGIAASVATGTVAALVLAIIVLGAVVAYEFLVTNLE
ncbi:MAG TPA: hypothetical protein VG329_12325 [Candidatus Dormibacteraeota bacterium]|nr:hypothetical protein [Candidatus Dormibacteraeota bacterium]